MPEGKNRRCYHTKDGGKYDHTQLSEAKRRHTGTLLLYSAMVVLTEYHKDVSIGLPPLNQGLARRLIEETKYTLHYPQGFRSKSPVDLRLIDETLVRVSNMIVDFLKSRNWISIRWSSVKISHCSRCPYCS